MEYIILAIVLILALLLIVWNVKKASKNGSCSSSWACSNKNDCVMKEEKKEADDK